MTTTRAERITRGQYELPMTEHALYRFYDRTDVLLYVGITMNLPGRLSQHRSSKPWWLTVAHIDVEYFPSRRAALDAEKIAIQAEHPLHNDVHNEYVSVPSSLDPLDESCGEYCDDECRAHHGPRASCSGRLDLAMDIIRQITPRIGNERFLKASNRAREELLKSADEREYGDESGESTIVAYELVNEASGDAWRFTRSVEQLLNAIPEYLRRAAEADAAHDWSCAGEPDALRGEQLPDVVRHLAARLSAHFGSEGFPEQATKPAVESGEW